MELRFFPFSIRHSQVSILRTQFAMMVSWECQIENSVFSFSIFYSQASILHIPLAMMISWEWRIENGSFSQRTENGNATFKCFHSQFAILKVIDLENRFTMLCEDENREWGEKMISWDQRIEIRNYSLGANALPKNWEC